MKYTGKEFFENMVVCLRPKKEDDVFAVDWEDLQVYVRVFVDDEHSAVVTNDMLAETGIDGNAILKKALDNLRNKIRIRSLDDVLAEYAPGDPRADAPILVALTEPEAYGAGALLLLGETMKNKWVIPSSVHEVLVLDKEGLREEDLSNMIRQVNASCLDPDEILSDHPYDLDSLEPFKAEVA